MNLFRNFPDMISSRLYKISYAKNIPLSATVEINQTCNLKCRHCYLGDARSGVKLKYETVKKLFGQLAEAGCLYLAISGGEPLLHPDVFRIIEFGRKKNMSVRLFTNGVLLTEETVKKLKLSGVSRVEVSLYGTEENHNYTTRDNTSYAKLIKGLLELKKQNIPRLIKIILTKYNLVDIPEMLKIAKRFSAPYQIDPIVIAADDGDPAPLKYRLTKKQLSYIYQNFLSRKVNLPCGAIDFLCGAGRNSVAITCDGTVYPCREWLFPLGNVGEQNFAEIWFGEAAKKIRQLQLSDFVWCKNCKHQIYCPYCPGLAHREVGPDFIHQKPPKILCFIAKTISSKKRKQMTVF